MSKVQWCLHMQVELELDEGAAMEFVDEFAKCMSDLLGDKATSPMRLMLHDPDEDLDDLSAQSAPSSELLN